VAERTTNAELKTVDLADAQSSAEWVERRATTPEGRAMIAAALRTLGRRVVELQERGKARGRGRPGGGSEAFGFAAIQAWSADPAALAPDSTGADASGLGADVEGAAGEDVPADDELAAGAPSDFDVDPGAAAGKPRKTCEGQPAPRPIRGKGLAAGRERRVVTHALPLGEQICPHCGLPMVVIGFDACEVLEILPRDISIDEHRSVKYACPEGHAVRQAEPPVRLSPESPAGISVGVELLATKTLDKMPLQRFQRHLASYGIEIPESDVYAWWAQTCTLLGPVAEAIRALAVADARALVAVDDSTLLVLNKPTTQEQVAADVDGRIGRMWVVVGDHRYVSVTYTPDWTKSSADHVVGARVGFLQADAYKGYDAIYAKGRAIEVACWAHTRRYFVKAMDRKDARAARPITLIARMYAVEGRAKGLTPEARRALRQAEAKGAFEELQAWAKKIAPSCEQKSPLGRALTYLRNQREALGRYLEDGRLPIDNTEVERQIRPFVVGRKNWMFAKTERGARHLADAYTVTSTALACGVNVREYLTWVLGHLARREWSVAEASARLLPEHFAALAKKD
jgi:transposase